VVCPLERRFSADHRFRLAFRPFHDRERDEKVDEIARYTAADNPYGNRVHNERRIRGFAEDSA
jgi:hypothetical protein